jgi:hypothetical protein
MMCLIVKSMKGFESAKFKHKLYSFDKTDINNFKFPEFMDGIKDEQLHKVVTKIVEKYKNKNYKNFYREELEDIKDWVDMEMLFLLKFYQGGWSIEIPQEEDFFPFWVFTYNLEPLKKQVDKIIAHAYDKIEPNTTKWWLKTATTFSALEVTYLLHYFVMIKPENTESEEEFEEAKEE